MNINIINSSLINSHLPHLLSGEQSLAIQTIQSAFENDIYKPYEKSLAKNYESWGSQTWLQRLQKCAKQTSPISEGELLPLFLFTVCINPQISDEEKQTLIIKMQQTVQKEIWKGFTFLLSDTQAFISINILRYCSNDIFEAAFKYMEKYKDVNKGLDERVYTWLEEIIQCPWAYPDKQAFLDRIFELIPLKKQEALIYHFLLQQDALFQIPPFFSEKLVVRFSMLQFELKEYGEGVLASLCDHAQIVRLPFNEDNKTCYFLKWFSDNAIDNPNSDLIAAGLSKEGWEWLHEKLKPKFSPFCFSSPEKKSKDLTFYMKKWIVSIAKRLQTSTLSKEELRGGNHNDRLWLYFNYSTEYILKNKSNDLSTLYLSLAEELTAQNLHRYHTAFKEEFLKNIVKVLVEKYPEKLVDWSIEIFANTTEHRETVAENLTKLFKLIHSNGQWEQVIPIFFDLSSPNNVSLTIFASLSESYQESILKHILADKESGLIFLQKWVDLCIELDRKIMHPFVRDSFLENFYKHLKQIDQAFPFEFKNLLTLTYQDSPKAIEFLDILLPLCEDLNDPFSRQKIAIEKLKLHFLTSAISYDDRTKFVRRINKDIRRDLIPSKVIEHLFHELPESTWPLLFLHFKSDICYSSFSSYYEEKSKGGSFKKVKEKFMQPAPPTTKMRGLQNENIGMEMVVQYANQIQNDPESNLHHLHDVLLWAQLATMMGLGEDSEINSQIGIKDYYHWIDIASETLNQMIGNPCINDDEIDWAMQHLFKQACNTNTLYQIIHRFIEKVEPKKFIPTLEYLSRSCFRYNDNDMHDLITFCIQKANIDKTTFIASCIENYNNQDFYSSITNTLIKEPVLQSDNEKAQVFYLLYNQMQMQFLNFFTNNAINIETLLKSLKNQSEVNCEGVFTTLVRSLCQSENNDADKFIVFLNICNSFMNIEIDVLRILGDNDLDRQMPIIKSWFTSDTLIKQLYLNSNSINITQCVVTLHSEYTT